MKASPTALLRAGPLGVAQEAAALLPDRQREAAERWIGTVQAMRQAYRRRPLWSLVGRAAVDGSPLHVVTDLSGDALAYWNNLLFAAPPAATARGSHRLPHRLALARDADLSLVAHHRAFRGLVRRYGCVTVPTWVDTGVPLSDTVEDTLRARRHGLRSRQSDLRRIRRADLVPVLVHDPAAVRGFLRDWYLPFVRERWGETCVHLDSGSMRRA